MSKGKRVTVRVMRSQEKKAVGAIMRRAFSPIQQLFFTWKGHVLVAERGGQLLGGTVLDTFTLSGDRKGGIVLWIFTDPAVHGQGAGQALTDAAVAYFEKQGCTDMFACVEGHNTSSNYLWTSRGFGILSPGAQFRRYGLATFAMWYHTFHVIDVGHFLWTRPPADQPDSPLLQWVGVLLMNSLLVWLALWREAGFQTFNPVILLIAPLAMLLFLGARSLAMLGAAKAQGITLRFRAWETGFPLGVAIALAVGGLYVNPGGFYPTSDRWRYSEWLPKLGPVALAGVLPTLLMSWALTAIGRFGNLPPDLVLWRNIAVLIGVVLSALDIIGAFFPLTCYNGRRLWDWNRWVWGVLAIVAAALFFV
jgi:ribosomal protein S18 acetylase RimI-like enzyme